MKIVNKIRWMAINKNSYIRPIHKPPRYDASESLHPYVAFVALMREAIRG